MHSAQHCSGSSSIDLLTRCLGILTEVASLLLEHFKKYRVQQPNLVHIYHPVTCDLQLSADQYRSCQASADNTFRSSVDSALALKKLGILND